MVVATKNVYKLFRNGSLHEHGSRNDQTFLGIALSNGEHDAIVSSLFSMLDTEVLLGEKSVSYPNIAI